MEHETWDVGCPDYRLKGRVMPSVLPARTAARRPLLRAMALLAVAALISPAVTVRAAAAEESPAAARTGIEQQVLFKASQDPGYACFRIPAIVKSTRGTLLAFAEGRVDNCGDAGDIDLVLKRSTDGARTWEDVTTLD